MRLATINRPPWTLNGFSGPSGNASLVPAGRPRSRFKNDRCAQLDDRWRPVLRLLVELQNRFLPSVRGTLARSTYSMAWDPAIGDYRDSYEDARRTFDSKRVLSSLPMEPAAVRDIHWRLAAKGIREDPMRHWFMLTRMAPYKERAKFEGAALLAHDAYDAAEMVRRFWSLHCGELLPAPDEIFDVSDGSWRERLLGHERRLTFDRGDLRRVLESKGLYPHPVHVVVGTVARRSSWPVSSSSWETPSPDLECRSASLAGSIRPIGNASYSALHRPTRAGAS